MRTYQAIIWLAVALALNGTACEVIAADVVEGSDPQNPTIKLKDGLMDVCAAHTYRADNGDVSTAIGLVDQAAFLDVRAQG